jgi:hypothetical protein
MAPRVDGGTKVASRRVLGAALVALILGGTAACGTTEQVYTSPEVSVSAKATATSAAAKAEKNAIYLLQGWLADPQPGTLTYNTIQVTSGGAINVLTILSGPFDPAGTATLTGSIATLGSGSTTQGASSALEYGKKVYTSIPTTLQTGSRAGKQWEVAPVRSTWASDVQLSGWWTALNSVKQVQSDGVTSLDGNAVDMFSVIIDLSTIKGVPKALLDSAAIKKAGTSKVEVDVYIAGGELVRVTYKFGLMVSIDATAQAGSTAGYEVDLSGFSDATASPSPTPTGTASVPPDPTTVASGAGDADLAALLPF